MQSAEYIYSACREEDCYCSVEFVLLLSVGFESSCVCVHCSQLSDSGEVEGDEEEGIKKCVDIKVSWPTYIP